MNRQTECNMKCGLKHNIFVIMCYKWEKCTSCSAEVGLSRQTLVQNDHSARLHHQLLHYTDQFRTSLCSAFYVSWQCYTACICCWVPAMQQSTDISRPAGPQQQTRHSGKQRLNDGMDRQRDRHTDAPQFHRPRCAYYANSVNKAHKWVSM